ncbi:AAA family ATPase [Mycolicibacterium fortuitum]|uniref:AAA family ATPase n=1 Tax=Mycolicibacterium fortuitum TaxID=1766 RepID=UPI0007EBE35F|nr:AAA family ATPase [Mycolicibacterium fortuitum]OBG43009.1 hypothetical protein A5670_01240 [Mycolicibacterium fortuitum]
MTDEYGRSASVEWASTIRPKKQVWLQDKRIPVGTVSALAGRGGTGKTTYMIELIGKLSRGLLPGKYYGQPRPSLIWSGEDQWDTVIVPRLIAAGADLNMVGRLAIESTIDGDTSEVAPKLPLDTFTIRDAVATTGAVLVGIDPIASTMSGDLNREADVRSAVDALARVSAETGAVMMFVRHFGKGGGNASDKMSGSHAFRDAVRSVFLFAEDGDRVIVTQDKGNYAPRGDESFAFRLESVSIPTDDGPAEVARVVDLGTSDISVSEVINRTDPGHDGDAHDIDTWLTELLATGSVKANEVYSSADAAGYSKDQAKRAKKRLGIQAVRETGDGPWFWKLETKGAGDQGSTPDSSGTAPLLPCTSEGVRQDENRPREHGAEDCSLGPPSPATMPTTLPSAKPRPPRERHRTISGKPASSYPTCTICDKPVTAGQGDTHLSCSKQLVAS